MRRIGVLTGGGDCPGLNAAIKWVVKGAMDDDVAARRGVRSEVIGIREGWEGLLVDHRAFPHGNPSHLEALDEVKVRKIDRDGGTYLGTSRTNPFSVRGERGERIDRSARVLENIAHLKLDAIVAIGGEDTLGVANGLSKLGAPVVGVPKTIDLDLPCTDYSLGFDSAVNNIKNLINHARTVAGSHRKTAIIEVMGRHSGFLAMQGGIASAASIVLIPEYPYDLGRVCELLVERSKTARYGLVVVAEGARPRDGELVTRGGVDAFGHTQLGGIGDVLAAEIKRRTGLDTFAEKLGYLQRGGEPTAFDLRMGRYFGISAIELVMRGEFGKMVAVQHGCIVAVPLRDLEQPLRVVNVEQQYDTEQYTPRRDSALGWPIL